MDEWRARFQRVINDTAGNDNLSFTTEVWTPGDGAKWKIGKKVSSETASSFPFLA